MKEKRIWILLLCCALAAALFTATPCRAADTGKTYTLTITSNISDDVLSANQYPGGIAIALLPPNVVNGNGEPYQFEKWEGVEGLNIVEGNATTTPMTFIMPERDVTLKSIFRSVNFTLATNLDGVIQTGQVIGGRSIVFPAPSAKDGFKFKEWEGTEGLKILEGDKGTDTISISAPFHDFTLKALYTRFDDVLPDAYCFDPVLWAVEKGITNGTSDTTFSPGNTCTTANIVTFLWRANGSPAPSGANPFSDVPASSYYEKAAVWAYEKGMVSGKTFNGGSACTRAATMQYLWILAGRPDSGNPSFTDVSPGADYAKAVAWAVGKGVTKGTSDTTFSPDNACTRGQIVTFLYRYYA